MAVALAFEREGGVRKLVPTPSLLQTFLVGQVGNLRPIGNRPVNNSESYTRRITNPPQVTNLPRLKSDAQAELHLACLESVGAGRLICYDSPGGRAVDVHGRVGRLKMIQEIRKLKHQSCADPLPDSNVLSDGRVQVPGWEPADYACSAVRRIETQDRTPELRADRVRVGEHIDARSAPGRIAVEAAAAGNRDIVVRRVAAGEGRDQNGVLIGLVAVPVNFPERSCV